MAVTMPEVEVRARPLRPSATWVQIPDASGRLRLTQVWTVLDPRAVGAVPAMRRPS